MNELIPAGKKIRRLIDEMEKSGLAVDPKSIPLNHFFCDGMYGRVMHLKAGDLIAGRKHLQAGINILLSGACVAYLKDGDTRNMVGPDIIISTPGAQRAFLAITDCSWMTILRTELKDPDQIYEQLTE